jgi:dUTP pyrophosphatase
VVQLSRNPSLDGELAQRLVELWVAVINAGGAVGFVPPVAPEDVWPTAEAAFAAARSGHDDLVVAFDGDTPTGMGVLATNDWAIAPHWAKVRRLQRHPDYRGLGIGGAVLGELEAAARDRELERLVLSLRGGAGRERFYLAHGFRLDARLPGRLRLAADDTREELVMSKPLTEETGSYGPTLAVQRLDEGVALPAYARPDDAGLDLQAASEVRLEPGERAVVSTGLAVAVPVGCVGLLHPRSGLAASHGIGLVNAPGTVDAGYRGEVKVVVINLDPSEAVTLSRGERIAQLVVQRVETVTVTEVDELPPSSRGEGGFGSTGR